MIGYTAKEILQAYDKGFEDGVAAFKQPKNCGTCDNIFRQQDGKYICEDLRSLQSRRLHATRDFVRPDMPICHWGGYTPKKPGLSPAPKEDTLAERLKPLP